jgi:hypothetical protein
MVEVGSEIPETLYRAVAEILSYVYRVQGRIPPGLGDADRSQAPDVQATPAGEE